MTTVDSAPAKAPARDPFDLPDVSGLTVGVLGGTGEQGRGLAMRWAAAGLSVIIGSRDPLRAREAAAQIGHGTRGMSNADCATHSDVILVAVPWAGHETLLRDLAGVLAGKVVIDCVNPLGFDKQGAYALDVPEGSAAQQAAALLPDSTVVGAFHNVSAVLLQDLSHDEVAMDVLVLGDVRTSTDTVQALANVVPGMRGLYGGRLRNCRQVEALTANLISMNRRYKAHAGVAITDIG